MSEIPFGTESKSNWDACFRERDNNKIEVPAEYADKGRVVVYCEAKQKD